MCAEWIAGRLGKDFGLPIPDFAQVEVSQDFVQQSAFPEIEDLGSGITFGSKHVAGCQEYDASLLASTPDTLKLDVLAFDLWIRNTDRTFTRPFGSSGNPNLLWESTNAKLWVIDHNNAFLPDNMLHATGFSNHVFYPERQTLTPAIHQQLLARMTGLLESVPLYFDELPQEWLYLDGNQSIRSPMTPERISAILRSGVENGGGLWRSLL